MLRSATFILALLWCTQALAVSEADRRNCTVTGDAKGRIEACTRILADPAAPPALRAMAHRNRGLAYAGRRLHEFAIVDFDEALKLDPKDAPALSGRARALGHKGQYDRALADYTEALRHSPAQRSRPQRARPHPSAQGRCRHRPGRLRSRPRCQSAQRACPQQSRPVLAKQNKLDEAIAGYGTAVSIDPDYLLGYVNRARAYEAKGEIERALADFKLAAERKATPKHDENARAQTAAKQAFSRLTKALAEGKIGPKAEHRVALVIGNSAYKRVPALRNPANDAKALAAVLRSVGFTEVRELIDADLGRLAKALKEFGDLAARPTGR